MSPKKKSSKKNLGLGNIQSLVPKNLKLDKLKINPIGVIKDTKNKLGNFYINLKKEREKEKKRLENKRKLDEIRELQKQKKQAQKEKLDKIKEEKRQILAQQKLIIDNEKQVRKNEEKRRKIELKRIKIEQQKIKDEEAKKIREDTLRLKEEELRLKMLDRQRIREEKIKAKEETIKLKELEAQKIREEKEKERQENIRLREIERQTQRNLMGDSASAVRAGAFGGSRQGLREAETITEGSRLAGDARTQAGARGLEFASQRFDQERAARLAAENAMRAGFETDEASRLRATETLQGFAPLVQGLTEQAASGLITAGQAERQLDQRALDMAYGDYLEQRNYPQEQLNFALGALQGVPYETRTIGLEQGQQYVQSPSIYGQTIGGLGSLASAYYLRNR